MINVFFEMNDWAIEQKKVKHKYIAKYNVQSTNFDINAWTTLNIPIKLIYTADRIWVEDDTTVKFYKNRYRDQSIPLTPIELKEFVWIKLKSQKI